MKDFTTALPFIAAFIGGTLLINMTLGEKITVMFLTLVLLSMAVMNTKAIENLLGKVTFK